MIKAVFEFLLFCMTVVSAFYFITGLAAHFLAITGNGPRLEGNERIQMIQAIMLSAIATAVCYASMRAF